jgi:hypothetical protein
MNLQVVSTSKSQSSSKRNRDSQSPKNANKRQKTEEGLEGIKLLRCKKWFKESIYNSKFQTMDYNLAIRIGWECISCKACCTWGKADQESKLILCNGWDRAYHIHCLDPPLKEVPSKAWNCSMWSDKNFRDTMCQGCAKILSTGEKTQMFEGKNSCLACHDLYQNDKFCKLCMRTYDENNTIDDFVWCDTCESWVHAACDGITKLRLQEMEISKIDYMCPPCRDNK